MTAAEATTALWNYRFDRPYGCALPEPLILAVGEITIKAAWLNVTRKCYDHLPTPTLTITLNGKRSSYAAAQAALK